MQRLRRVLHIAVIFSMLMTLVAVAFPAAVGAANLLITPATHDFGGVEVGSTSADQEFTVLNNGNVAVTIVDVTMFAGAGNFDVTASGCLNAVLLVGQQCVFHVVFEPSILGDLQGTIEIDLAGADPSSFVTVHGSGKNPVVQYAPAAPFNFGNVQLGQTSVQQVVTVTNTGTEEIQFIGPVFSSGDPDFVVEPLSGFACPLNIPLGPGSSCSVRVTFNPSSLGPINGAMAFQYTTEGGLVTTSYALMGTGVQAQLSAAPNPVNFGNQLVNTDSAPQPVTFTNTGVGPITIASTILTGSDSTQWSEVIGAGNCTGAVLAPGASCTEYVIFSPTSVGPKSTSLRANIPNVPAGVYPTASFDVLLTGTGTTPTGTAAPQFINFGSQQVGTTSTPVQVTITNTSAGGYTLPALAVAPAGQYAIQNDLCSGAFLAAGGSCTFTVLFQPTSTGIKNATITVGPGTAVQLTGVGVIGSVSVTPNPVVFGNQEVGTESAPQVLTITNTGIGPITITSAAEASIHFDEDSDNCSGQTLQPGQNCQIMVVFTPQTTGVISRTFTINYLSGAVPDTYTVTLIGTGTPTPLLITEPDGTNDGQYDFGNVVIGQTAQAIFIVTNTGNASVLLPAAGGVITPGAGPFSEASDTCDGGTTLNPGQSCSIIVNFAPTAVGPAVGLLTVNPMVQLQGNGVSPNGALLASQPQLSFGPQQIGSQSQTQQLIITNPGNVAVTINAITVSPNDYITVAGVNTNCQPGLALDPGASCSLWVAFQPDGPAGDLNGQIRVDYTGSVAGTLIVLLRGTATTPNGSVDPLQLDFGVQEINTTSGVQTVTFTNTGLSTVVLPVVTIGGPAAADYLIQTDSCSNASVLPGATCTVSVVFRPATAGAKNADLRVGPLANPVVVTLKGVGFDPQIIVTPAGPVDFGNVIVDGAGGNASLRAFTVTNTASNPKVIPAPILSGPFTVEANDCTILNPLGPGQSCTIVIRFDPTVVGPANGTLTVNPVIILMGMGVAANGALSVAPPQLSFGPQQIGTQSQTQQVVVSNNGNIAVNITGVTVVGPDYILANGAGNTCQTGVVLGPGESCAFWVAFLPTAPPGPKNSQVNVTYTSAAVPAGVVSVLLRGNAITPNGTVSPLQLDFGLVEVHTTSAVQTVTFTNTGTEIIAPVPVVTIGGVDPTQFAIQTDSCSLASVLPGESCTISVVFRPDTAGVKEAELRVGPLPNPIAVTLKGIGVDATISVTPLDYNFGSVVVGQTAIHAFTVTNNGSSAVVIPAAIMAGSAAFSVLSQDCSILNPLGPGASCTIVVQFAPTAVGPVNGTMTVNPVVTLHGTGVAPSGALSANPIQLTFGNIQVGSMSSTQVITYTNTGTIPVSLTSLPGLNGPNLGDFLLTQAGNTCQIGIALNPGESCSVGVAFRPMAAGNREAWVTLTYTSASVANGVISVLLRGVGITPVLSISPAQLTFGNQTLNTASAAQTVTVTNSTNGPLTLGALTKGGTNPGDYQIISDLCSNATLAAGTSCSFKVIFLPVSSAGPKTATVIIPVAGLSDVTVALSGQALAAQQGAVQITPSFVNFGFHQVLSPTAPTTVTFKNTGSAVVTLNSVIIGGANAGDFTPILAGDCGAGKTLNPGEQCTVQVRFRPTAQGPREATLEFSSDAPGSTHVVGLYGVGITPVLSINPSQLNFGNLQVGVASAPYTVTLVNTSQVSGVTIDSVVLAGADFALINNQCGGQTLAPGGSCTFRVVFQPLGTGVRNGTATINLTAGNGGPFVIDLVGVGLTPDGIVSPLQLDFGNIQVGVWSAPQTVKFTNTGSGPVTIPPIVLSGPNAGDFLIQTDECSNATVESGGDCDISVIFRPSLQGPRNATLEIPLFNPVAVTLKGNGQVPSPQFQAAAVDFGTQPLLVQSAPRRVTVTNVGPGSLILFGPPTLGGANAADFSIVGGTCTDRTLATNESCYVDVTFKPLPPLNPDPDIRTAYVEFITNMPTPARQVPLTGQVGQFNVNVVTGANACLTVTLSPAGPYAGNAEVTATATIAGTDVFIGWYLDGYFVGFANPIDFKIKNSSHSIEAVCVPKPTFSDIAASPYKTQIEMMAANGFLKGYFGTSGPYGPSDNVLRSQMAVVIARMANRTNGWNNETPANPFTDQCNADGCVDPESWNAVAVGFQKQVIRGLGFGVFGPFSNVTEIQVVAFTSRMMIAVTAELELRGRYPSCPDAPIPAPPVGVVSPCPTPPNMLTGTEGAFPATKWEQQLDNVAVYGDVLQSSGHRIDISTYYYYVGGVPGPTGANIGPATAWPTWTTAAKRQQIAAIMWAAYADFWGVDRIDEFP